MDLKELLCSLCPANGVSGDEKDIAEVSADILKKYCRNIKNENGNLIAETGSRSEKAVHIMLDAHMDQVGMIVTSVTDKGFIKAAGIGGLDGRLLPAQKIIIHGKTSDIPGVICSVPPHLCSEDKKVISVDNIMIDTGYRCDELKKLIEPGDLISFDMPFSALHNDFVTSPALDDRSGMAAIIYALCLLKDENLNAAVTVLFSTQEELGEIGAETGCYNIAPDIALAVDVSFAKTNDDPETYGRFGGGPMIGISPSLSREISDDLIKTANNNNIPYQLEIMEGITSTDADKFSVSRGGVKTCTVSIPLRYMHTPSEVVSLKDVELTGRLIAEYIKGVK